LADHGVYASTVTGWHYYGAAGIKSVDVAPSEDPETGTISHCVGLSRHRGRPVVVYCAEDRGEAEAKAREVGERLHKPVRLM
jgi:hypothetical protein